MHELEAGLDTTIEPIKLRYLFLANPSLAYKHHWLQWRFSHQGATLPRRQIIFHLTKLHFSGVKLADNRKSLITFSISLQTLLGMGISVRIWRGILANTCFTSTSRAVKESSLLPQPETVFMETIHQREVGPFQISNEQKDTQVPWERGSNGNVQKIVYTILGLDTTFPHKKLASYKITIDQLLLDI